MQNQLNLDLFDCTSDEGSQGSLAPEEPLASVDQQPQQPVPEVIVISDSEEESSDPLCLPDARKEQEVPAVLPDGRQAEGTYLGFLCFKGGRFEAGLPVHRLTLLPVGAVIL